MKKIKLLAAVAAVVTGILLFFYLNSLNKPVVIEKYQVITAAINIPANTKITSEMITVSELPAEAVVGGALTSTSKVLGMVSKYEIFTGEQILTSNLVSVGEGENDTLAYAVEPGMRAITISVNTASGLSNMLAPGNRIDLIGEFLVEDKTAEVAEGEEPPQISYTVMVLDNILVLAVDDVLSKDGKLNSDSPEYLTITLQVTPAQAMHLSMAVYEGELRAILRSPLDKDESDLPNLTLDDVLAG